MKSEEEPLKINFTGEVTDKEFELMHKIFGEKLKTTKPAWWSTIIISLVGIAGILLVYGIINFFLVGAQVLYHKPDNDKINEMKSYLDTTKAEIDKFETNLPILQQRIEVMKAEMDRLKTTGNLYQYNNMINSFNSLLVNYKSDYQTYEKDIAEYNQKVAEYNDLAKRIGIKVYYILIPRIGKATPVGE